MIDHEEHLLYTKIREHEQPTLRIVLLKAKSRLVIEEGCNLRLLQPLLQTAAMLVCHPCVLNWPHFEVEKGYATYLDAFEDLRSLLIVVGKNMCFPDGNDVG